MNIKPTTYTNTIVQPQLKAVTGIASEEETNSKKLEKVTDKRELDRYVELTKKSEVDMQKRIEEIKEQLKNGTYTVSPELIADAMFYEMNGVE